MSFGCEHVFDCFNCGRMICEDCQRSCPACMAELCVACEDFHTEDEHSDELGAGGEDEDE